MRTKSAYRTKLADNIPTETPNIPEEPIQPSETVRIEFTNNKVDPSVGIVSADEYPEPDEATLTLQKQIADLKKSEELQRNYARYAAQQQIAAPAPTLPADPEARIALWRTQGLDEGDAAFLSEHLEMAERPDLTRLASDEAAQHHQRGTDDHRQLTKEIFDQHLALRQAAPAAPVQPAPAFFAPPSPVSEPAGPASYVSAPVSRHAAGSPRELSPSQVRLSPAEVEMARIAGISPAEYARQRQRLDFEKKTGQRQ
jgi:hypothetical protein